MSLEYISRDISLKAEKEIEKLTSEHLKEVSRLKKEFEIELEEYKSNLSKKYLSEISTQKKQILSKANQTARKLILETKSNLINILKISTKEDLINLPLSDKKTLFKIIIKKVKESNFVYDKIYVGKTDFDLFKKNFKNEAKNLEEKENFFGLIFYNSKKKVSVSFSYDEIIDFVYEQFEDKILKLLFK